MELLLNPTRLMQRVKQGFAILGLRARAGQPRSVRQCVDAASVVSTHEPATTKILRVFRFARLEAKAWHGDWLKIDIGVYLRDF